MAAAVRSRVHDVARRLGYVPDATAQHLRRRAGHSMGLLVSDLTLSFDAELAAGVEQEARRRGYAVVLASQQSLRAGSGVEGDGVTPFVELRVAGVIMIPASLGGGTYLREHGIAVVDVDHRGGTGDGVSADHAAGTHGATAELIALGHRRVALLLADRGAAAEQDRETGYRRALGEAGLPADERLVLPAGTEVAAVQERARRLLAGPARPTAVVAANPVLAEGVWRAAADLGLEIPGELSLIAGDDAAWMTLVAPGVTVMSRDVTAMGSAAVGVLLDRLADPGTPPRTVVVPAELRRRGSTGPPPA